ncbi:MAG: hypothetical protein ABTQ25_09015 [Nitrosomonas ureae]
MPRLRWCKRTDKWIDLDEAPKKRRKIVNGVIPDSIDPFLSHADGKIYDSKSSYRRMLKQNGYEEVGNDKMQDRYKVREERFRESHKEFMKSFKENLYKQF